MILTQHIDHLLSGRVAGYFPPALVENIPAFKDFVLDLAGLKNPIKSKGPAGTGGLNGNIPQVK
jgi:hypothetical protein